ncbi:hypothetical protein PHMEG_00018721 [Phytophthora megakarya]|uniref:Uncharacterized protein n=1 Tax=Phytophthora megakarya TaxID=4795 RepID=A0A225VT43_9STRA|nr:hypothetical protein PHMEG_00018721 [Phytophthora megakarya]
MKKEVQELTVQHQVLLAGIPTKTTPWSAVVTYWDIFRNGLKRSRHLQGPTITLDATDFQKNFLHSVMAANVSANTGFGVEAIFDDWKLLSRNIDDLDIQLLRLENDEKDSIVAYVRGTATMTESMLRNEFPHLIQGESPQKWFSIASRLLGQQLEVFTTMRFVWDPFNGRIVSALYTEDLVTPLQKLLGDLGDVAYMLRMPPGKSRWGSNFDSRKA